MKYIIAALFLTGCMTTEKATNYLLKSQKLGEICADKYPPKTGYRQGETITKRDTTYLPGDSVPCPPSINGRDKVKVFAKCPPHKVIRDTIYRVDTTVVENTARVLDLQYKLGDRDNEILMLKDENKERGKWNLILSVALVFAVGIPLILKYLKF